MISYPKSGRTWLRVMLDDIGVVAKVHHGAAQPLHETTEDFSLSIDYDLYKGAFLIYLMRDPRDVIVSSFHHTVAKTNLFKGTREEFIHHPRFGIEKLLAFQDMWLANQDRLDPFLLLTYEELTRSTPEVLRRVADFVRAPWVRDRDIRAAIATFEFRTMQRLEKSGLLRMRYGTPLKVVDKENANALKTRKGKIGGYLDELTSDEIAYCNQCLSRYPRLTAWYPV